MQRQIDCTGLRLSITAHYVAIHRQEEIALQRRSASFLAWGLLQAAALVGWCGNAAEEAARSPDDAYVLGRDSQPQPGVPKGKTFTFTFDRSKVFPGTSREITIYIPAQYTGEKPACLYVGLDGLLFEAPTVFDNLIAHHEMPVTIGIGVASGVVQSAGVVGNPRFNRSFEFDGLNDNLARFLLEELLPEVERRLTPDGVPIKLSKDPNDRAAGGNSTGGIGSFTLAWQRPDSFRRVFVAIGTFVGMRGGDRYPVLVRKTEPKPLRIFMQDGSNDGLPNFLDEVGDWWMSNQAMERALVFSGYQVTHVWGNGSHSVKHASAIFPDAMRWLWKDWPQPITAGESKNSFLNAILQPGNAWQVLTGSFESSGPLTANQQGDVTFLDGNTKQIIKVLPDGKANAYPEARKDYTRIAYGPDGRAYLATSAGVIVHGESGKPLTAAQSMHVLDMVVDYRNALYITDDGDGTAMGGKLWLITAEGQKTLLDTGLNHPSAVALSPDGLWLAVAEARSHWGYSYRVTPEGTTQDKQRFYWFHVPDDSDSSGVSAWSMDRDGRLYAGTRMGVQVFDRNGRVRAILPTPGGAVTGLTFGGPSFDTLYISNTDGQIFKRKLKALAAPSWVPPIKLPAANAG